MVQALYRKYRSRKLNEVIGQEHITKTLSNALKAGRINHAYLLTGPRGVGKTSVARILAHLVNDLPYKSDDSHLDIIEIDAASNRRIDEIRDLRDKVHITPTTAKYKVYIIDEVHMLTKEAFNALLKTLEEPPAHAIFILATTEAHKLPETIISRTQRFTFKPIDVKQAMNRLKQIAKSESIDIDDDSLKLIAQHGTGSFRDSISILDQLSSGSNKITPKDVLTMLGVVPDKAIEELVETITKGSPKQLLSKLEDLRLQGFMAPQVAKQLSGHFRKSLLSDKNSGLLELLKKLLDAQASFNPEQLLELILLEYQLNNVNILNEVVNTEPEDDNQTQQVETTPKSTKASTKPSINTKELPKETWAKILLAVKKHHNTLYSILRMAEATFDDKKNLTLTFRFAFHQKRIAEAKNMDALKQIISQYLPGELSIQTRTKQQQSEELVYSEAGTKNIETISNIFGSAEVLE